MSKKREASVRDLLRVDPFAWGSVEMVQTLAPGAKVVKLNAFLPSVEVDVVPVDDTGVCMPVDGANRELLKSLPAIFWCFIIPSSGASGVPMIARPRRVSPRWVHCSIAASTWPC